MADPRRLTVLSKHVLATARALIPDGPCVMALSGGADSAVCAWAAREAGQSVRGVFVHHGLPGSGVMQQAAEEVSAALGLGLTVHAVAVPTGPSPEAQSRRVRYSALQDELAPAETLLTGHTADDQAETVLSNLVRGTGLRGLAGIPVRRDRVVRPLLSVWRRETRELATLLGFPWREDPLNLDERTPRNALRLTVLPYLEDAFNPALRQALVRLSAHARREEDLLEEHAARVKLTTVEGTVRVPAPVLTTLPLPIAERVVRRALRQVHPPYGGSDRDVRALLDVARGVGARTVQGGFQAAREGSWLVLVPAEASDLPEPVAWDLRGEVGFGSWRIQAWVEETQPPAFPLSPWMAVFDADLVAPKGQVRPAGRGDRIAMHSGRKHVAEALAEAQVPAPERARWPVVVTGGDVIWIPGIRTAQTNWVTLQTRRYLWMRAEREAR